MPSQQQDNSAANQEIKAADSQVVLTIYQQSPTQETFKELIRLQAKQTELGSLLIQQQRKLNLPSKEPPVFFFRKCVRLPCIHHGVGLNYLRKRSFE